MKKFSSGRDFINAVHINSKPIKIKTNEECLQFVIILYIDRLLQRERMKRIDSTQQTYIIMCTFLYLSYNI